MNFREHFEAWHQRRYGYKGEGAGTALNFTYRTQLVQARWEAWQACAGWHTAQDFERHMQKKVKVSDANG